MLSRFRPNYRVISNNVYLLNYSIPLEDVPQKVVDYVAYQLQISSYSLSDARDPRYGQIALINKYTGFSAFSAIEQNNLNTWLIEEAEKQSHLIDLINDAIFYLKEKRVELPSFQRLVRLVASALHEADKRQSILGIFAHPPEKVYFKIIQVDQI